MKKLHVQRKTFTIGEEQILYIQSYCEKIGMSESEFIRRLIDQHMVGQRDSILIRENSEVKIYGE